MPKHDILLIGASLGGLEPLKQIVAALPADLPAALLVAMHTAAGYDSALPSILARHTGLKPVLAIHGEPVVNGHIYIAPPDNHLMLRSGQLSVQRGPKENGHRPAVDPLFRSAAQAYGSRVVGVVLSGGLDCGTAGLLSIKARGGIAIVQTPDEASVPSMPLSAVKHVGVDFVLTAQEIGKRLVALAHEEATPAKVEMVDHAIMQMEGDELGQNSHIVCPLCQGALTEAHLKDLTTFRCHVGHAFSPAALLAEQAESLERAMWAAVRALEESAALAARLSHSSDSLLRDRLSEKTRMQYQQAELIRRMLLGIGSVTVEDGERVATHQVGES